VKVAVQVMGLVAPLQPSPVNVPPALEVNDKVEPVGMAPAPTQARVAVTVEVVALP
jgi:hypothetical protein